MTPERKTILHQYSMWTCVSAFRRGPRCYRSKAKIQAALEYVRFALVLDESHGRIHSDEFEKWHRQEIERLRKFAPEIRDQYGWLAKLINVYLKTYTYIGGEGRVGLKQCIHPPIDSGLWKGIKQEYDNKTPEGKRVLTHTHHVTKIKDISNRRIYNKIIGGLGIAAEKANCDLIEVEQFWRP